MATLLDTHCGVCGAIASRITLLAPGEKPPGHADWDDQLATSWEEYAAQGTAERLIYRGIEAGTGPFGTEISTARAQTFRDVLGPPLDVEHVRRLDLYDDASVCIPCGTPYCAVHWHMRGGSGLGICPEGHTKSLDPF